MNNALKLLFVVAASVGIIWLLWASASIDNVPCSGSGRQMPDETTVCDLGNGWVAECVNGAEVWTKYDAAGSPVTSRDSEYLADNC